MARQGLISLDCVQVLVPPPLTAFVRLTVTMINQMRRLALGPLRRSMVRANDVLLQADAVMENIDNTSCKSVVAVILSASKSHLCLLKPCTALDIVIAVEMTSMTCQKI
jgi:hypothetical protein